MSWLARSIANSLKLDDEDEGDDQYHSNTPNPNVTDSKSSPNEESDHQKQSQSPSSPSSTTSATTPRGVKEDLSELTKTLTRQFWGVASFLAPPPELSSSDHSSQISNELADVSQPQQPSDPEDSNEDLIAGIRSDFAEIGGRFKTGISKLSGNAAVSEITKMASNFLQLGSEKEFADGDLIGTAAGVTQEVVAFARDISMHPETWLDFPVTDDEDFGDFDMSDAQQEHALTVEHLASRLAALRLELCPGYMSEGCFWKIYFVLLHPRLSKHDAELLSTPQIMEARAMLSCQLEKPVKPSKTGWSEIGTSSSKEISILPLEESLSVPSRMSESVPLKTSSSEVVSPTVVPKASINETVSSGTADEQETEKHPVQSTEMQIIDKAVVEEKPFNHTKGQNLSSSITVAVDEKFEDEADDWLREDSSEMVGTSAPRIPVENDEDVSFSDLEEDDEDVPIRYKKVTSSSDTSTKDSRDWVDLSKSSADSVKDINPVSVKHAGPEQVSSRNSESKESDDWLDVDDIDVM